MASQNTRSPPSSAIASGATRNGTSLSDRVVREPRPLAEHRHEGEQIERERQHPEERRGGDVGRDVGGHRDDEAGRDGGERGPGEPVAHARRAAACRRRCAMTRGRAPRYNGSRPRSAGEPGKADRPEPRLAAQRQQRLDARADRRAAPRTSRDSRPRRARRGCAPARCPLAANQLLQQRRARRQRGERQPDRGREQRRPARARCRSSGGAPKPCAMPIGSVSAAAASTPRCTSAAGPSGSVRASRCA